MTLLPALITWYQFGEPTVDHNEACGQNAVASDLVAGGFLPADSQAPLSVDSWMRAQGWPGLSTNGTDTWQLSAALQHFAPGCSPYDHGSDFNAIHDVLGLFHYPIVLVGSDHLGHPVPNSQAVTGHWVAVYGDDNGFVIANSGSGQNEYYTSTYFASCFRGVVLDSGISPAKIPILLPPLPSGEDMTMDVARAICWMFRLQLFGLSALSEKDAQLAIDTYAAQMVKGNPEGILDNMLKDAQKDGRLNPAYKI